MGKKFLLATGVGGFAGTALANRLARGHEVFELHPSSVSCPDIRIESDVREWVAKASKAAPIGAALHLAGQPSIPKSFEDPEGTFDVNYHGTAHFLGALRASGFDGKFVHVSSADVYGGGSGSFPITEAHPLNPKNPYAHSKCCAELLCVQWSRCGWMRAAVARPFNHIGPGQSDGFSISKFCKAAVEMAAGSGGRLEVGSLSSTRDFLDVRDVAEAYLSLLGSEFDAGEAYNICSGVELGMRQALGTILSKAGLGWDSVLEAADNPRQNDTARLLGDSSKLSKLTGWSPKISFGESIDGTLDYWKERLG